VLDVEDDVGELGQGFLSIGADRNPATRFRLTPVQGPKKSPPGWVSGRARRS
jgi:hypothetical protein